MIRLVFELPLTTIKAFFIVNFIQGYVMGSKRSDCWLFYLRVNTRFMSCCGCKLSCHLCSSVSQTHHHKAKYVSVVGLKLCQRHRQAKSLLLSVNLESFDQSLSFIGSHVASPPRSQAYIHTRMRAKTSDFLKVLNRARPDAEKKEMKTIS